MRIIRYSSLVTIDLGPYDVKVIRDEPDTSVSLGLRLKELEDKIHGLDVAHPERILQAAMSLPFATEGGVVHRGSGMGILAKIEDVK